MKKNNESDQFLFSMGLFAVAFMGFYFIFTYSSDSDQVNSDSVDIIKLDRQVDDAVNRSLKHVNTEKSLRDLVISSETHEMTNAFKDSAKKWTPDKQFKPDIYQEDTSKSEADFSSLSLEEKLRYQIEEKKEIVKNEQFEKQEYIRQFKANALKDGWIVEVNDKMEVVSAKRAN